MPLTQSGWSAWISVDGKELPQYAVRVEEEPGSPPDIPKFYTVSCWIPSQIGKEFAIYIDHDSNIQRETACVGKLSVDGHLLSSVIYKPNYEFPFVRKRFHENSRTQRSLVFAPLKLTDEEGLNFKNELKDLGTITIALGRRELLNRIKADLRPIPKDLLKPTAVHETTKKAGCHRISLGQVKKLKTARQRYQWSTHKPDKGPFLTFKFQYRSVEILRAHDIMPLIEPALPTVTAEPLTLGSQSNPIEIDWEDKDTIRSDSNADEEIRLERMYKLKKRKSQSGTLKLPLSKRTKIKEEIRVTSEIIDLT
ncbi:hypothetical protein M422DRAFT_774954 [Sphaerobolus stellatus SS14]|nr:hypothetical protein M422DRAFT_774954 [Sphaerobolus stellatus SS14]